MRGDGPSVRREPHGLNRFPPHARGWTHPSTSRRVPRRVSPACAGMDPIPVTRFRIKRCFPRMRGDGPVMASERSRLSGFPPHARGWTGAHAASLTRPPTTFPPHARGWTLQRYFFSSKLRVFPACAGMDRSSTNVSTGNDRFPRMRGDGPVLFCWMGRVRHAFPPHARGWTLIVLQGGDVQTTRFPRMRGDGPAVFGIILVPTC